MIAIHSPTWKNPSRMAGQWRQTLRDYAHPCIGRKRVSEVATADVLAILKPIWSSKPATARAVHQRIGAVMKWAVAKGYRPDNPAGDAIAAALPRNGNAIRHHKALPHGEVAAALAKVRDSESHAGVRLALGFMVLTATYAGGNSLHLAAVAQSRGYADVRWGTYRQIQARGGQVRKGEQGTRILSFQEHRRIAVTDERGRPRRDAEGKRVYRYERLPVPYVRQYTVFNAEQADGLPARPTPTAEPLWKVHQNAVKVLEDSGVPVRHVAGDRAFYNLNRDEIVLPERGQFPSANHYYQTALHELGHSTGHPERMNRATLTQGRDRRRVRVAGLCEGGAPRGDQRHDDRRARGRSGVTTVRRLAVRAAGLADLGRRVDLVERSVRRGEGDPELVDSLRRDTEGDWE